MEDKINDAFEHWAAEEMGKPVALIKELKAQNALGKTYYRGRKLNDRYRAWRAAINFSHIFIKGE